MFTYCITDKFGGVLPDVNNALVLFLFGEQAAPKVFLYLFHVQQSLLNDLRLLRRNGDIRHSQCGARLGGIAEADVFDVVSKNGRFILPNDVIAIGD